MWYSAKVEYYNDIKLEIDYGIVFGEDYSKAMEKVLADYGEENIAKVTLTWMTDNQVLRIDGEETLKNIEDNLV